MKKSIVLAMALIGAPLAASAGSVTYEVTGTINNIENVSGLIPSQFSGVLDGDTFTFIYSVNTSASPSGCPSCVYNSAVSQASVSFGGSVPEALPVGSGNSVPIVQASADQTNGSSIYSTEYAALTATDGVSPTFTGIQTGASIHLVASSSQPLGIYSESQLESVVPNPFSPAAANAENLFALEFTNYVNGISTESPADISGTISSIQVVPLPAAAWLMLSGLGGFGALARKKRAA
jgi:hypothetical protein